MKWKLGDKTKKPVAKNTVVITSGFPNEQIISFQATSSNVSAKVFDLCSEYGEPTCNDDRYRLEGQFTINECYDTQEVFNYLVGEIPGARGEKAKGYE